MSREDIVIIGAPRSGTNMLRDVLTSIPGFTTWDCDEINLIWRHGNRSLPHDELEARHATQSVRAYLRRQFDRVRRDARDVAVVEKTCANSLRVEFVYQVKPEARYVFITRDGLDAAASAMRRWHAGFDLSYTLPKVKNSPLSDLPYYGSQFVLNRWAKRRSRAGRGQGWWGPKVRDWEELSRDRPLDELCLLQWKHCVDSAQRGLALIPSGQVHHVSYERFVSDPEAGLQSLLRFIGEPDLYDPASVRRVSISSIGKGRSTLPGDAQERLQAIGSATLERLGYVS